MRDAAREITSFPVSLMNKVARDCARNCARCVEMGLLKGLLWFEVQLGIS